MQKTDQSGVSLIELVIAIAVVALLSVASLYALARGQTVQTETKLRLEAAQAIENRVEELRASTASWATQIGAGGQLYAGPHGPISLSQPSGGTLSYTVLDAGAYAAGDTSIRRIDLVVDYSFQSRPRSVAATTIIAEKGLRTAP